jgi:cytochrome c-type biogenesis protein CcmH/NrfF
MSPHDYTWLLFATPAAVAAIGALVYYATARQDRAESHHGR